MNRIYMTQFKLNSFWPFNFNYRNLSRLTYKIFGNINVINRYHHNDALDELQLRSFLNEKLSYIKVPLTIPQLFCKNKLEISFNREISMTIFFDMLHCCICSFIIYINYIFFIYISNLINKFYKKKTDSFFLTVGIWYTLVS